MSFRRLISIGALAASAAVLPALPGHADPTTGRCPNPDYPTNSSKLSLSVSPHTVTAGRSVSAFGALRKNDCAIKGARIRIERKRIVNGAATGGWALVKRTTTDKNGLYLTSVAPLHNEFLRARFAGTSDGKFQPATSGRTAVKVRTKITEAAAKGAGCKITLTGATTPAKANHLVTIQKRGPKGHFHGWNTFASGRTGRTGQYSITKTATCGTTYNLSALIAKDSTNLGGRSATIFGIKATR
jgi:hypothetical protein